MSQRSLSMAGVVLFLLAAVPDDTLAVDKKKAQCMGGTLTGVPEKAEALVLTDDPKALEFRFEKGGRTMIPYERIVELEYGQKAGHRVKTAILLSPLAPFSKARHHYLTISWKDDKDQDQAGVFEFGKEVPRAKIKVIEIRSGKEITFTDEDSKKHFLK